MRLLAPIGACALAASCTSYTPPAPTAQTSVMVISRDVDRAWSDLIAYARANLFRIEDRDRRAGEVTLAFGGREPARYVDCGRYSVNLITGEDWYDGPYATYLTEHLGGRLEARMTVRLKEVDQGRTEVDVETRYELEVPDSDRHPRMNFVFDQRAPDTERRKTAVFSPTQVRSCGSTGVAERELLGALGVFPAAGS